MGSGRSAASLPVRKEQQIPADDRLRMGLSRELHRTNSLLATLPYVSLPNRAKLPDLAGNCDWLPAAREEHKSVAFGSRKHKVRHGDGAILGKGLDRGAVDYHLEIIRTIFN